MRAFWRICSLVFAIVLVGSVASAQQGGGWFGVEVGDVSKEEADKLRWDAPHGAKVRKVELGSPAEKAGLKVGDIILTLDRTEIDSAADFSAVIEGKSVGAELRLRVLSAGRELRMTAVLATRRIATTARDLPILQLDTGGHMSAIKDLLFTPDGKYIVSAGYDKVIRVWDWQEGKTVRTIRGEVGPGDQGKIYAMTLSPDGRWLATGGWHEVLGKRGHVVRLFDFATGALVALLEGHTNVVDDLAFAPDGKRLISGSADNTAIIWDVEGRRLVHHLQGHPGRVYAVAFTPDAARVVTAGDGNTVKLWSVADGKEIAAFVGHKTHVRSVAVSALNVVASGGHDDEIRLWDGTTGKFLRSLQSPSTGSGALSFDPSGKMLLATSGTRKGKHTATVWDLATDKPLASYLKHDNVLLAAAVSPDGRLAATGGGDSRQIHVWDLRTGETRRELVGTGAAGWATGFSSDGHRIAWSHTWSSGHSSVPQPLEFHLRLPTLSVRLGRPETIGGTAASFLRARLTNGTYTLVHRKGGEYGYDAVLDVMKDGKAERSITRGSSDGFAHRSYTFTPDGRSIVSGGNNGVLAIYDLQGKTLGHFVGHEGDIWAVTPSADGRLLWSGSADQTIRLWSIKTRELIATLFHGKDGEWVMWTPQGYYSGSPGADKSVGWQINKGPDNAAEFVGADQLRQHLNRPDIVEKAIILASAEQAVREAPGTSFKLADLLAKPVPRFRIVSPSGGSAQRGGRAQVKITLEAVPDPIKAMRVQVNGRQVSEITADVGSGGIKAGDHDLDVPLGKGRNEVRITLTNTIGDRTETLVLNHESDGDLDKRGTLYILAIGVERYPGLGNTCGAYGTQSCDLRFAGADARKLVEAAERRLAPAHTKVIKRVLVNGVDDKDAPTAGNILDAIDVLKDTTETDTVLLFIAGHGVNDGASYRFLATNAERSGTSFRGQTVVSWQLLQEAIETAKGRRILFLDTCHSGNAYNQKLGNAAYHANIIAYTSARFDQEALEDAQLGHGLFTYAVVEGLDGKGDLATEREISTKALHDYVVKRVDQLAKDMKAEQEPQYFRGRDAEDYVLARW